MKNQKNFAAPLLVSLMLIISFCMIYANHRQMFTEVEKAYAEGTACNLGRNTKAGELARVLHTSGYISDVDDANFIGEWITSRLRDNGIPNLGALNKKEFSIPVDTALALGGPLTRERAEDAIRAEGYTAELEDMYSQSRPSGEVQVGEGTHLIKAVVMRPDSNAGLRHSVMQIVRNRLTGKPVGQPVAGVLVCLRGYSYDMSSDAYGNEVSGEVRDSVIAYGMTDACGVARFRVPEGYYSVRPIARGKSYGRARGTSDERLRSDKEWVFTEKELTIAPLSKQQFVQAKQDLSLTVRTPSQYKDCLIACTLAFLAVWWGCLLLLSWLDRRSIARAAGRQGGHAKGPVDRIVFSLLMTLSALNLMAMFGISQPLVDMNIGGSMAFALMGVVLMCAVSRISLPAFSNGRYRIWPFGTSRKTFGYLPEGFGYFIIALALMFALLLFGSGPEGSGARVNLLGAQPSELIKYLIVLMTASFFTGRAKLIRSFSEQADFRRQGRLLLGMAACMVVLMFFYAALSDMGPAMVLIMSFVLIYSVSRQDTSQLIVGTLTFGAVMLLARFLNPTTTTAMMFTVVWLLAWVGINWKVSHQLYESAILMVLVISAFFFSEDLFSMCGMEDIANRLASRNAMAGSGIWMNDTAGGDQVAQGIWGLCSGGLSGKGLGRGYPSSIPAYNTDMIISSIGEVLGWVGVVLIVVCLAALVHRTLLLGRRAGHPFVFFLLTGIAVSTAIQFYVIVLGSQGVIPLTGVSVPLLSFGRASMIINLMAFGIVLSGSRERATVNQKKEVEKHDSVVATSIVTFIVLGVFVLANMFDYQVLRRNKYMVRPALMADARGVPFAEYNPRIQRMERKMLIGNVYDRNGLLLATSSPDDIRQGQHDLEQAGLARADLNALANRRQKRFYPFGMHTVFAVGDLNEGYVRDGNANYPKGFGAEYRYLTRLRGFDNQLRDSTGSVKVVRMKTSRFRPCRFLPKKEETFAIPLRDYSDPKLVAMLRTGEESWLLDKFNGERVNRDIRLTVDARLQTLMQRRMEEAFRPVTNAAGAGTPRRKLRAAVVVTNAVTGDLLCSANYPLPTRQSLLFDGRYSSIERDREAIGITPQDLGTTFGTQPGSTAKVITQMAAFRKLGPGASTLTYNIRDNELIHDHDRGMVDIRRALVRSNNAFHVHLAHDQNVYPQYAVIDYLVGLRLHLGLPGENRMSYMPYYFYPDEQLCDSSSYRDEMSHLEQVALPLYRHLRERNTRVNNRPWTAMSAFGAAWGQHNIMATPLSMARVAAIVANDGRFVPTRYLADEPVPEPVEVIDAESVRFLQESMRQESQRHQMNSNGIYHFPVAMGGKTGTPERVMPGQRNLVNDAWYVCFIPLQDNGGTLAVSIRIERAVSNSSMAVRYINDVVLPTLHDAGYRIFGE